jgi:regulator of sigma E protease
MGFIMTVFYFVVVVGVLVFIHEFGHFIAARISGMRVDVFAIGMGFRLFGWNKKTGFTWGALPTDFDGEGNTDYRLSAFPIGGYVKIAGMIDESMDDNFTQSEPQPWEFRSKNAFLKAFTISAGVIMNALLAIGIFSYLIFSKGEFQNPTTSVGFVKNASLAEKIGFKINDKITSINDARVNTWQELQQNLAIRDMGGAKKIELQRDGRKIVLFADGEQIMRTLSEQKPLGLAPNNSYVYLTGVETVKAAGKAGLRENDTIISANNEPVRASAQFVSIIKASKEKPMTIQYKRGNDTVNVSLTPDGQGIIGVGINENFYGPILHKTYGLGESISMGYQEAVSSIDVFFATFTQIFKGNISAKQSLGGPILIAKSASQQAEMGFANFMHFVALLSITLAIVNILPVPALDGGHLIFIIIEAIIRREVPLKFKMAVQQAGLLLIVLLMVFMFYNDITRVLGL